MLRTKSNYEAPELQVFPLLGDVIMTQSLNYGGENEAATSLTEDSELTYQF